MWTYDITQIATSTLYQVRYLIGDTLEKDQQIADEELTWAITQRTSIYGAAADACRNLATQMARQADSVQGPLRTQYSSRSRSYAAAAQRYETMAMARSSALPYSGQTDILDYRANTFFPDRMGPQFAIGMMDKDGPPVRQENATDLGDVG